MEVCIKKGFAPGKALFEPHLRMEAKYEKNTVFFYTAFFGADFNAFESFECTAGSNLSIH
jgi:hypothetical protein